MDDTLARHTGKHIASGAMHRAPLLSTGRKPFFHFGHNWVVLSIVFSFSDWEKTFSLPVLVRLYRTAQRTLPGARPHGCGLVRSAPKNEWTRAPTGKGRAAPQAG